MVVTEKNVLIFSMGCPGTLATGRVSRSVARRSENKCSDPLRGRNVGQTMLLPIVILVLVLSPVLIPALVTAFHLVARRRNSNEVVRVARRRFTALATEGY